MKKDMGFLNFILHVMVIWFNITGLFSLNDIDLDFAHKEIE